MPRPEPKEATANGRIAMAITLEELPEVDYTVDNPGLLLLSRLSAVLVEALGGAVAP